MSILTVQNLNKRYEKFHLKDVSFTLDKGYIMGFIGANGAGKTTTIKSMLNLVHADSGTVSVLGRDFMENELILKKEVGVMLGGVDYYAKTKLRKITDVVKRFYPNWDNGVYDGYIKRFGLDEDKKVSELSSGMRIKYALTLALSHNAKLLVLDEPTSGLDPAARDDLLELFQSLIEDGEKSILFSTHITSDLEKCADFITFIHNGQIVSSAAKDDFLSSYRLVKGTSAQLTDALKQRLISLKANAFGFSGLIHAEDLFESDNITVEAPTLEDIMIYYAKREALQ